MAWKKKVHKLGQCVQILPLQKSWMGHLNTIFPCEDGNLNITIFKRLNSRGAVPWGDFDGHIILRHCCTVEVALKG